MWDLRAILSPRIRVKKPRNHAVLEMRGFLSAGGPNAHAATVSATFWIERVRDKDGNEFDQLQYTQRVLLNFNGLNWPHVTVATLVGQLLPAIYVVKAAPR